MKKKVLYGVTAAILGCASMVSLQSCKDDLSDFEHRYDFEMGNQASSLNELWYRCFGNNPHFETLSLEERIKALENFRQGLEDFAKANGVDTYQALMEKVYSEIYRTDSQDPTQGGLLQKYTYLYNGIYDTNDGLLKKYLDLNKQINGDGNEDKGLVGEVGENTSGIQSLKEALYGKEGETDGGINGRLLNLIKDLYGEDGKSGQMATITGDISDIKNILNGKDEDPGVLNNIQKLLKAIYGDPESADEKAKLGLEERVKDLEGRELPPDLSKEVEELQKQVKALKEDMAVVKKQIEVLVQRFDKLITGLIIQRAFGPVFGDFSLPIGIQSNILFNWYGENLAETSQFPFQEEGLEGVNFSDFKGIEKDLSNYYKEVDLGNIYLTANPVGHDFSYQNLVLEASNGYQLPYKLNIIKDDYKLAFGATRAEGGLDNGFYKANIKVQVADLQEDTKIVLDHSKLKDAAKSAVDDPSISTAANLVKAVYDQINRNLTAYALRYDWKAPKTTGITATTTTTGEGDDATTNVTVSGPTENGDYAVLSKYELAVAAAQPLAYTTLSGAHTSKRLPTGHLDSFFKKLKEKALNKINVNAIASVKGNKVSVEKIEFDNKNNQIVATVTGMKVDGSAIILDRMGFRDQGLDIQSVGGVPGSFEVACGTEPDHAVEILNDALVAVLCRVTNNEYNNAYKAEAELKLDAILLEMNNQINQIIADLKGDISKGFDSVHNSNYFDLANQAFKLYNRFANKINEFLEDPNEALQVAAFYDTKSDLGVLSQNDKSATPFVGEGDEITIYLSSYTGEVLAPAYKKFFACFTHPAINADSEDLDKVLEGNQIAVKINTSNMKSGETYGFLYQGLDYFGNTSSKKFYIKVN